MAFPAPIDRGGVVHFPDPYGSARVTGDHGSYNAMDTATLVSEG
ncbi:MAG: hypothetical protein ACLSTO_02450 [Bilophila wadsworthia]